MLIYTLDEWNELAKKGEVLESQIQRRDEFHLINIECSDCGSHLWEYEIPDQDIMMVKCLSCGHESLRERGKSE